MKFVGSSFTASLKSRLGVAEDKSRVKDALSGMQMSAQIKKLNSRFIFSSGESRERKTLNGKTTSPSYPNVIKGG